MAKIRDKAPASKTSKAMPKKAIVKVSKPSVFAKSPRKAALPLPAPNKAKTAAKIQKKPAPFAEPPTTEAPPPPPLPAPVVVPQDLQGAPKATPHGALLTVSIQTSQGMAASGNNQPANLLVVVTCAGWPVLELTKDHFTLMQHFEVPGQTAPFSNNITTFRNAGTGAYLLQIKPINAAPWKSGHHLGQLLISTPEDQQGQAAFKLIIR